MKKTPYEHAARMAIRVLLEHRINEVGRILTDAAPPGQGFAVFFFDWNEGGPIAYVSNGDRADVLRMMREWIEQTHAQQRSES